MSSIPAKPSSVCACPSCGRKVAEPHPQYPFCSEVCRAAERAARPDDGVVRLREPVPLGADPGSSSTPQDWQEFIAG